MKLENQVCNLELAKCLKELGVKQASLFWWQVCADSTTELQYEKTTTNYGIPVQDYYSAFTIAELGDMLPKDNVWGGAWSNTRGGWSNRHALTDEMHADTEADVRAKMLLYLLENKLVDIQALNDDR